MDLIRRLKWRIMQGPSVSHSLVPYSQPEVSPNPIESAPRSSLLKREMPGLDVLRGLAILSVLFFHGLKWDIPAGPAEPLVRQIGQIFAFGWLGVNLFFILSGFLITGILLDTRTHENYWRGFYVRRMLRIIPLYLVVLVILKIWLHCEWFYLSLCLFYLANFASSFGGRPVYGTLWSLAVEEQFYLIWPYLVSRLHLRTLAIVCVTGIAVSPVLRAISMANMLPLGDVYSATWLVCDNLFYGALIAIFLRTAAATDRRVAQLTVITGVAGATMLGAGFFFHLMSRATPAGAAYQPMPFMMIFLSMLLISLRFGDHPFVYRLLSPIRFFGYISYGLYLFHLFGFLAFDSLMDRFHWHAHTLTASFLLFRFVFVCSGTVLFCFLSRRYFEEFFLRFKERLVPRSSQAKRRKVESVEVLSG
jgi:peptidoglycan/LPS O-acetylase OafA/YrhL